QGRGLRPHRRHPHADRLLDRVRRQADGRGDRGDRPRAGRGGEGHRRRLPQGPGLRRVPAGAAAAGRPLDLPARQQPARLRDRGHRRRRRHRRHADERVQALRLRLRLRDPHRHDRDHPRERGLERPHPQGADMTSTTSTPSPYRWLRFTTALRLVRFVAYLGTVAVLAWAVRDLDIYWPWVWDAPVQIRDLFVRMSPPKLTGLVPDRKSTRLNSSHVKISYAVFCLKKKKIN